VKKPSEICINVSGGTEEAKSISLTLPWDSNIEDWKEAFVTILTHQSFAPETIRDLFFNEEDNRSEYEY